MEHKLSGYLELIKNDHLVFLNYLKAKFPLFHNSNFFFRDFQYGLKKFLEKKEIEVKYPEAEKLAHEAAKYLQEKGIFVPVNNQAWRLNYPDFVTTKPGDPL